jgi:hypothetical protein
MKKNIRHIDFKLPVSIIKEGKSYIAYSYALDLSTCGKSFNEAKKRFGEIVAIFFEELIKKDSLDKVLENLGWSKVKKNWMPPMLISQELEEMKIPALI